MDRAAAGAARCDALEKKGAGGLRLQVKYNAVYAYEVLGCGQEEFVKDWNKTTGSVHKERHSLYSMQKRNQRPSLYTSLK